MRALLENTFKKMKQGTEYLNYGRDIIADWGARFLLENGGGIVFDTGCGHGDDLLGIRRRFVELGGDASSLRLTGVEGYEPFAEECRASGIETFDLDIERDPLPFPDATVDLIVTNQVLEHTKEIFWIMSEYARILKPGGCLIIGVPNLASLHNRLLLLVGLHPTAQQSLSAHVRSFTLPDLKKFTETGGFFTFVARRGSNFYPFPPIISRPLARLFPSMAWGLFAQFRRTDRTGSFLSCLEGEENFLETPFYGGPQRPARVPLKETTGRLSTVTERKVAVSHATAVPARPSAKKSAKKTAKKTLNR